MEEDYKVMIGKGECIVRHVVDNNIVCKPPQKQSDPLGSKYPRVQVSSHYKFSISFSTEGNKNLVPVGHVGLNLIVKDLKTSPVQLHKKHYGACSISFVAPK